MSARVKVDENLLDNMNYRVTCAARANSCLASGSGFLTVRNNTVSSELRQSPRESGRVAPARARWCRSGVMATSIFHQRKKPCHKDRQPRRFWHLVGRRRTQNVFTQNFFRAVACGPMQQKLCCIKARHRVAHAKIDRPGAIADSKNVEGVFASEVVADGELKRLIKRNRR